MTIIILVIILVLLAAIGLVLYKNYFSVKLKGKDGEQIVSSILGKTVEGQQYVINNLLFTDDTGKSCQIDHVLVNRAGIWIIETKNYSGMIYGREEQREWTQVLANGRVKNKFYNPVKQNTTHVYRLAEYLGVKIEVFHNLVVFLGRADISNVVSSHAVATYKLNDVIHGVSNDILSVSQMKEYYLKIAELKDGQDIDEKKHVENIREMQKNVKNGICPRCGGKLVLRKGQYGEFYGCSNYPKCKFTKKLD